MNENKKYELTIDEINMFIGLAAAEISVDGEKGIQQVEFAANIANRIGQHLNGKKPFAQDMIDEYRSSRELVRDHMLDALLDILIGGIAPPTTSSGVKEER